MGDDSVAIIGQHINTPPVAPTWHNGQCPRSLEALIVRMLAKDPSERPDAATDVFVALDVIDLAISGEVPAIPDDEAHSLDRLVGEPFVYVRNAERDSNDPADLSVSRSLLGQIIIADWDEDLYKSSGD